MPEESIEKGSEFSDDELQLLKKQVMQHQISVKN